MVAGITGTYCSDCRYVCEKCNRPIDANYYKRQGYLENVEKAKVLEEALKKIDSQKMCELPDDMAERVATVTGLWISLKFIARESLAKYRKDR